MALSKSFWNCAAVFKFSVSTDSVWPDEKVSMCSIASLLSLTILILTIGNKYSVLGEELVCHSNRGELINYFCEQAILM